MDTFNEINIAGGDTGTPLNIQKRLEIIKKELPVDDCWVLDAGCGVGEYVAMLGELPNVTAMGIEYLGDKIASVNEYNPNRPMIQQGDIENLGLTDDTFDIVLMNEVIEHVPNEARVLRQIRRVLKPDGKLIIFAPNRVFPFETHGVYWRGTKRKVPAYTPLIPYIPVSVGEVFFDYWARNYWQHQLRELISGNGFRILNLNYVWQTFENISGHQPQAITVLKPLLRRVSSILEQTPIIRRFGVSQIIVAQKDSAYKG